MVFTRQKSIVGANPSSPPRTQPETNIREVHNPSRTVFTQEHNQLFVQIDVQYSQENEVDHLYYHILGLNESSTEDNMKKIIVKYLCDFTLTKISIQ